MFLGLLAARLGHVLTLPGWFWTIFLGILYLIIGLVLLRARLPFTVSGFHVPRDRPHWLGLFANKQGLNPAVLGVVFAIVPGPYDHSDQRYCSGQRANVIRVFGFGFFRFRTQSAPGVFLYALGAQPVPTEPIHTCFAPGARHAPGHSSPLFFVGSARFL